MTSIRRRLLLWLTLGLILSTVVAAYAVYTRARAQARELFDHQLQLMVSAFPDQGFRSTQPSPLQGTGDNAVVVQIWNARRRQIYSSHPGAKLPHSEGLGFSVVSMPSGEWRVYTAQLGENTIQISQPRKVREELATELALRTMLPMIVWLPVIMALTWITVGQGLKPLDEVATAVSKRSASALAPLPDDNLPTEVRPLVSALNDLLARLGHALRLQRSFIADAAHELRTPLTAVSLQAQVAEQAASYEERSAAMERLKGGINRAVHLVQQLLTLARNDPDAAEWTYSSVNVTAIARDVIMEQVPIAEAKDIDLGLSNTDAVIINGHADALRVMIGNLVDNAVKYTPPGGTVDVDTTTVDGDCCIVVTDTGHGIPAARRARVFERFYRYRPGGVSGSGLGLAIVRTIAERHGASVELAEGYNDCGLKVIVRFHRHRDAFSS